MINEIRTLSSFMHWRQDLVLQIFFTKCRVQKIHLKLLLQVRNTSTLVIHDVQLKTTDSKHGTYIGWKTTFTIYKLYNHNFENKTNFETIIVKVIFFEVFMVQIVVKFQGLVASIVNIRVYVTCLNTYLLSDVCTYVHMGCQQVKGWMNLA